MSPPASKESPAQTSGIYPQYTYSARMLSGLASAVLFGRRRNFREDAKACIARLRPPLCIQGMPSIPPERCCVLTLNHYFRPGFQAQWSAFSISANLPVDVHWIMTGELTFPGSWFAPLGQPISRFVLGRIAAVYGFTSMPPMPPRPRDVAARAAAVHRMLQHIKHNPRSVIALAPEGSDQPGGLLSMPPNGLGRFCLLLAEAGAQFIPVGVFERDGQLTLNFGAPYGLEGMPGADAHERDRFAAGLIMRRIAVLLPRELQGEFQTQVETQG